MFQQVQQRSKILSTGVYLPKQRVKSDDLFAEIKSLRKMRLTHLMVLIFKLLI